MTTNDMSIHWLWPYAAVAAVLVAAVLVAVIAIFRGRRRPPRDGMPVYSLDDDLNTEHASHLFHLWRLLGRIAVAALMAAHPEKEDEYLNLFVDIQMKVHACTCPMLNSLTEKMQRKISATDLDATTRYELHTRLASMHVHKKVCHGDFNPSNIIITPDGQWYILDWSHATQGNASADVARTYLLFVLEGKEALAEKYLSLFCKKSDTAKQYVQQWIPIVAASQSLKGKPEERDLLIRWASVCEYE